MLFFCMCFRFVIYLVFYSGGIAKPYLLLGGSTSRGDLLLMTDLYGSVSVTSVINMFAMRAVLGLCDGG